MEDASRNGQSNQNGLIIDKAGIKRKVQIENDITYMKSLLKKYTPKVRWGKVQLGCFFIILYLLSFQMKVWVHPTNAMITELRQAIIGVNLTLVYIGVIVLPTPTIVRPHYLFWRTQQACAFAYLVNITFMLFFSKDNLKWILENVFDPNQATIEPFERDYAMDCRVYTPENPDSNFANIMGAFDVFFVAHAIGWLVKAWIFRNYWLGWCSSISFELMELSLRYWFANFNECWWDSLLMDVFGMNQLGLLLGEWTIRKFNMKRYNWFMASDEKSENMSAWENFKYFFTARNEYKRAGKWHILSSAKNLLHVIWFMIFVLLVDLSNFFNKSNLNLPASHWLLGIRIWIVGFFAILAAADYYKYIVYRKGYSMGINIFMAKMMQIVETLLYFKNIDMKKYETELPWEVYFYWAIGLSILAIVVQYQIVEDLFFSDYFKSNQSAKTIKKVKSN